MFVVDNLNDLRILAIFFLVFDDFFDGDLGREDEREFEALREKYKLKEFPDSWKRLKKVEKLDLKSPDFVKLKRAFQKPTRYVILNI